METWMMVAAGGGVLGLIALGGLVWAFRKLESPKKWMAIGGFVVLGGVGGFLALNATAVAGPDVTEEIPEADDLDAPLDDDF
ncbi:MAG: hypothetical protein AAGE52_03380 [Myxococcota bacterium]